MEIEVKAKKPYNLESAHINDSFDKGKSALEKKGYKIISLEENAKLRMQEGTDKDISRYGNWTREGVIYLPSKEVYLAKQSPIIKNAEEATDCHRKKYEFYLTDNQVSDAIKKGMAVKFPKNQDYAIPTDKFGEDAITDFAFGKIAKDYGLFLEEEDKIYAMPVWLAGFENRLFARQMYFECLGFDGMSDLFGKHRDLSYVDNRVRGTRKVNGEFL